MDSLPYSCRRDSQRTEWFRCQQRPCGHRRSGGRLQQEAQLWPRWGRRFYTVRTFVLTCRWCWLGFCQNNEHKCCKLKITGLAEHQFGISLHPDPWHQCQSVCFSSLISLVSSESLNLDSSLIMNSSDLPLLSRWPCAPPLLGVLLPHLPEGPTFMV